jgi:uncharacterized ferritin-like protein (DUF455 family)
LSQTPQDLAAAAVGVLTTAEAAAKAAAGRATAKAWRDGRISEVGRASPPERPARPPRPELRPPRGVPRRSIGAAPKGRIALLHALAHIELNALDLAWDLIARFSGPDSKWDSKWDLPRAFFDDWVAVADDEARHFTLLTERLAALGAAYGDLPAHDGLWQAASDTRHDLLARLAVVPLVLEARGLDVTPAMIAAAGHLPRRDRPCGGGQALVRLGLRPGRPGAGGNLARPGRAPLQGHPEAAVQRSRAPRRRPDARNLWAARHGLSRQIIASTH